MEYDALMALAKRRFDALMAEEEAERKSGRRNFAGVRPDGTPRRKRGRPKLNRRATCHPDREHVAKGLCNACYLAERAKTQEKRPARKRKARAAA